MISITAAMASTSAGYAVWQVSVFASPRTILFTIVGITLEVASPTGADKMAFFYASWTGHVASTHSTIEHTLFSITIADASSAAAKLFAIFYTLRTSHVTSTSEAVICVVSSCITLARRRAASAICVAGGGDRDPVKHNWQQSDEQQ